MGLHGSLLGRGLGLSFCAAVDPREKDEHPGGGLEASMQLRAILSVAVGVWIVVLVVVLALCRAAKESDDAMDRALANEIGTGRDAEVARPPSARRQLRTLSLEQAAILLDVNPDGLLAWEARYGFPASSPSERRYNQSDVLALRDALEDGLSIASAVIRARERTKRRPAVIASQPVEHRDGGLAS
jgi:hypothetical protein